MHSNIDLDTDSPDKVPAILRRAAQAYCESATELQSAWQDKQAGKPWELIAREFEKLADRLEKRL